jgi:hypothetical protein
MTAFIKCVTLSERRSGPATKGPPQSSVADVTTRARWLIYRSALTDQHLGQPASPFVAVATWRYCRRLIDPGH